MKIGDIVVSKDEKVFKLHSGCQSYAYAIVTSLEPFVLMSLEGDMMWDTTIKPEFFDVTHELDNMVCTEPNETNMFKSNKTTFKEQALIKAIERLNRDMEDVKTQLRSAREKIEADKPRESGEAYFGPDKTESNDFLHHT